MKIHINISPARDELIWEQDGAPAYRLTRKALQLEPLRYLFPHQRLAYLFASRQ